MLAVQDFSTITRLCQAISSIIQPGDVLDSISRFMQTAEGIGGVFFWAAVGAGCGYGFWRLFKWLSREGENSHFSCMELMGEVILLGVFLLPAATIGAYLGSVLDNLLPIQQGLNFVFLLMGLFVGIFLWRRASSP